VIAYTCKCWNISVVSVVFIENFQHNQQYDTLLPIIPCRHKLKAGIAYFALFHFEFVIAASWKRRKRNLRLVTWNKFARKDNITNQTDPFVLVVEKNYGIKPTDFRDESNPSVAAVPLPCSIVIVTCQY
jgi:hypothetical protein